MKNKDPNNETSTYMSISYKSWDVSKKKALLATPHGCSGFSILKAGFGFFICLSL